MRVPARSSSAPEGGRSRAAGVPGRRPGARAGASSERPRAHQHRPITSLASSSSSPRVPARRRLPGPTRLLSLFAWGWRPPTRGSATGRSCRGEVHPGELTATERLPRGIARGRLSICFTWNAVGARPRSSPRGAEKRRAAGRLPVASTRAAGHASARDGPGRQMRTARTSSGSSGLHGAELTWGMPHTASRARARGGVPPLTGLAWASHGPA